MLALVMSADAIDVAELRWARGAVTVVRRSRLNLDAPASLDDPETLGGKLATHLREQGMRGRAAVVGLPARWLLARSRSMPHSSNEADRQNMLRLAIEREFVDGGRELAFDYMVRAKGEGRDGVLLVAAQRELLAKLDRVMRAAKLSVVAATPTLLAVAAQLKEKRTALLYVARGGVELLPCREGEATGLACVELGSATATDAAADGTLRAAVHRALTTKSDHATANGDATLSVAFDRGATSSEAVSAALRPIGRLREVGQVDAAAAVGATCLNGRSPDIDLAHGKLAAVRAPRLSGGRRLAVLAAAVVLALAAGGGAVWQRAAARVDALQAEYDAVREEAQRLQRVRTRTTAAGPWFAQRPRLLESLAVITRCVPDNGRVRVTSLRWDERLAGSAQCRAESREDMLAMLEAMQAAPELRDVRLQVSSEVERGSEAVNFDITFAFAGTFGAALAAEGGR